jgi:hypothetical protein
VEFLVISLFHETKILTVDMNQASSNFSKKFFWKKTKSPSSMRNGRLSLPSVGASIKKWRCCTPILPKSPAHLQTSKKIKVKKIKKLQKKRSGM